MSEPALAQHAPQSTITLRHAIRANYMFRPIGEEDFTVERFQDYLDDHCLLLIAEEGGAPVGSLLASRYAV